MSGRTRVGVVFGGRSPEHAVSVVSARSILREADPQRFEAVPFGISRGGSWLTPAETRRRLERVAVGETDTLGDDSDGQLLRAHEVLDALADLDVVFPIVHGRLGEDGTLQGLCELADKPCVGSGVAASAVGMDKALMRAAFAAAGLPQPRYAVLRDDDAVQPPPDLLRAIEGEIGYPCFVKPANGGSSLGVSKARTREDLIEGAATAARYDRKILIEEAIGGREVECAVIGNAHPSASPLGEIRPKAEFYTYEAKYSDDTTELIVPAALADDTAMRVQEAALAAYAAVDCAGMARVDFFVTPDDDIRIIEVNTLPGFTPISMYPRLWQHAGMSYAALISRLVDLAVERHEETRRYA
ncbi:MAG: D-alanine--D-alanine ligase [Dehalococcoidia bacterium]|nr:D-alanine--D-alanine ligase [Dehalococcoidia bacterium]HRC61617.1 D-alanine--D-alanine ligase family protein [Dehalococcoidia bacterium]